MKEEELRKLREKKLLCKECGNPILPSHSFMVTEEGPVHMATREGLLCWERGKEKKEEDARKGGKEAGR